MSFSGVLLARVKSLLKIKGITYAKLAARLGVSESTAKRWFSTGNLSLSQLDQICEILDLSLEELARTGAAGLQREDFSRKQEEFLADNEPALVLFYLISGGVSFDQISAIYKFKLEEIERQALQLDKMNLIEFHSNDRVRALKKIGTWWDPKGPLSRKYYDLIKGDFIASDFSKSREEQWFFSGLLTSTSQAIISKKLNHLAIEIAELYRVDQNDKSAKNITLFSGMRPWAFPLLKKYLRKPRALDDA